MEPQIPGMTSDSPSPVGEPARKEGSWHRLAIFFVAFLSATIPMGCSGGGGENAPTGPEPKGGSRTDTVVMLDVAFHPETLKVRPGDTVVFINRDIVDHDVTDHDDDAYASGTLKPGDSWKHVFENDANYYCSLHVIMEGRIEVENNAD
mgnify:CR=1 FL=1